MFSYVFRVFQRTWRNVNCPFRSLTFFFCFFYNTVQKNKTKKKKKCLAGYNGGDETTTIDRVVATIAGPAVAGNTDDNSNFHKLLRRLECEGLQRIRMFTTICIVYALFWGPLFLVVAFGSRASEEGRGLASVGPPKDPASHQVTLYICFAHAFINPTVFLLLHSGLREAACAVLSCCFGRDCRSGHHSPDPSGHYGDCRAGSFDHRSHHLQPQRRPPATLTGLVDYDRIINFNGGPSFLSPVHTFSPTLAAPSSSAVADSRPM